jgi:hypothetical protein
MEIAEVIGFLLVSRADHCGYESTGHGLGILTEFWVQDDARCN